MVRKYNKRCYGRQDLLLLPSGLENPKKTLDNPYTHMLTSVMLPRQITLPHPPNQANSFAPTLLQPLSSLFAAPLLCFQQLAASFPKTPGVGVPMHASLSESATCRLFSASASRPLRLCVILGPRIRLAKGRSNTETTTALTIFRINTCKSVSKQRTLTPFRMNTCEKRGGERGSAPK